MSQMLVSDADLTALVALEDSDGTYLVSAATMLQCLWLADDEGCVPPLGQEWWDLSLPESIRPAPRDRNAPMLPELPVSYAENCIPKTESI